MQFHRRAALGILLASAIAGPAFAQAFPAKPIKIIVPFPAGGGTDLFARTVGQKLTETNKWTVVIDNKPGAGGKLGVDAVAKSAPDGYTLVLGQTSNLAINPTLYSKLPYDPVKDLAPVALVASAPLLVVVAADSPFKSLADIVAAAKAKPGALNFGSAGSGSATHINAEKFRSVAGYDAVHVPYKGTPEAITETIAGRLDYFFAPIVSALPMIRDGKLKALAVGTGKRSAVMPQLPTTVEAGVPGSEYLFWVGLFAPAKTPKAVVERVQAEVAKIMTAPELKERLDKLGAEAFTMPSAQFDQFLVDETAKAQQVVKAAGIKVD